MPATAEEIGDIACTDEETLLIVTEQFVPVDESGEPTVACSILPAEYVPDIVRTTGVIFADCTLSPDDEISVCPIRIVEAVDRGRAFYIAKDWFAHVDADALGDLLMQEETFLQIGLPCDLADCKIGEPSGGTMLAAE